MRDRLHWETPTAGLTLLRELQLIVDTASLLELAQVERNRDQAHGAPHIDPAWLSDDPALD